MDMQYVEMNDNYERRIMSVYKDLITGKWFVKIRYTNWQGEKKETTKRGFRTKKDALQYEAEFKVAKTNAFDMVFKDFVNVYFEDKKGELKESSIRNKKHMIKKHLIPYFGDKKMSDIKPSDIIKWQNEIRELNLKPTYERMLQNQMNALFNHAAKIYNFANNPCGKIKKMGNADANEMKFWTKEEYRTFIECVDATSEDFLMFEILFWTGMREGELLALTPKDIDLFKNQIRIDKTYSRIDGIDTITSPKTNTSTRTIHIPEFLKREIGDYLGMLYGLPSDERIFPIVARTLQKRFQKYILESGVKKIRIHDLRHSHVAYLINLGTDPLLIKERLGHKDIRITLNTYGHLYPSKQIQLAKMLDQERE